MKKLKKLFALLSILFCFIFVNSCGVDVLDALDENSYYVMRYSVSGPPNFYRVSTENIGKTANLQVYVEKGYNYNKANITKVATKFENHYRDMINIYGNHTDMDNNGKIKLLFVDINGNNRSSSVVMGYFYPGDLIYGNLNNGEILYMDINLLNSKPDEIAGTVLHEFQHLINFNVNYLRKGKEMSLWLDECLAESTAVLFDESTIKSRNEEFNKIDYYCFYTWKLPISSYGFVNYPSASVFMNWLYIKNGRNSNIFKRIASSSQFEDYNKVFYAVSGLGNTWDGLLTNWIDGVRKGNVNGAKINTRSSAYLYPGALIYDGSQVRVNPSTELSNPSPITVSRANTISGRSAINNGEEEINLQSMEIKIENNTNNNEPKYIDLVFDRNGKVRKY